MEGRPLIRITGLLDAVAKHPHLSLYVTVSERWLLLRHCKILITRFRLRSRRFDPWSNRREKEGVVRSTFRNSWSRTGNSKGCRV